MFWVDPAWCRPLPNRGQCAGILSFAPPDEVSRDCCVSVDQPSGDLEIVGAASLRSLKGCGFKRMVVLNSRASSDRRKGMQKNPFRLNFPIGRGDISAVDVGDSLGAAIAHHQFQFALHDFDHAIDPRLAERS